MGTGLIFGCLTPHPPVLVPAVGGRRADQVVRTRTAMSQIAQEVAALSPDTLLVISPHAPIDSRSMGVVSAERYEGSFESFGAPCIGVGADCDSELAAALERECQTQDVPLSVLRRTGQPYILDHGVAVPLFFLREAGVEARLLLTAFSALGVDVHLRFGQAISAAALATGKRVVLVASGDFSHRLIPGAPAGYSPKGRQFDDAVVSALRGRDYDSLLHLDDGLRLEAGECGYRSLVVALGALPRSPVEVLSYEGPFGVGYLVARFPVEEARGSEETLSEAATLGAGYSEEEMAILDLARRAIESYVREGTVIEPPETLEGLLAGRAGVFVSLKIDGDLRGCVGTFEPTEPSIAAEVIRNGIAAAVNDPRFVPVRVDELLRLSYSVDLLSKPERVSGASQLDPKRYGVIVRAWGRRGLLLPDLEGVSTVEDQLAIVRRKAAIPPQAPEELYRFTVRRIGER